MDSSAKVIDHLDRHDKGRTAILEILKWKFGKITFAQ